jgi:hypothetical protein
MKGNDISCNFNHYIINIKLFKRTTKQTFIESKWACNTGLNGQKPRLKCGKLTDNDDDGDHSSHDPSIQVILKKGLALSCGGHRKSPFYLITTWPCHDILISIPEFAWTSKITNTIISRYILSFSRQLRQIFSRLNISYTLFFGYDYLYYELIWLCTVGVLCYFVFFCKIISVSFIYTV